ncbi:MAG: hypothetical protein ACI93R_001672 [Flavobacteriales bacterium]|jgi:hypothetical protein
MAGNISPVIKKIDNIFLQAIEQIARAPRLTIYRFLILK